MLSEKQIENRRKGIGGSDARTVMYGDHAAWQALRAEKVDGVRPEFKDDHRFLMDLGHATEPLTLARFASKKGPLKQLPPEHVIHWRDDPFFFFTPDGILEATGEPVQAKFHTGDKSILELGDQYAPQLMHEMLCSGQSKCWLAVTFGHYGRFMHLPVERDAELLEQYIMKALEFKRFMETGEIPLSMVAEMKVAAIPRKRDHFWPAGHNEVAPICKVILETCGPSMKFDQALKEMKSLVPRDAASATWIDNDGYGLKFKIDGRGAVRWSQVFPHSVDVKKVKKAKAA